VCAAIQYIADMCVVGYYLEVTGGDALTNFKFLIICLSQRRKGKKKLSLV
jgi:hypothetical protein